MAQVGGRTENACGNAEMRRRREERRVSGGGEKKPRRLTAHNDGFRHRKSPGNKQNPNENHPAPKQKPLPKSRRPILAESKKLPILPAGDENHLYDRAPGPIPSFRLSSELLVNWPLTESFTKMCAMRHHSSSSDLNYSGIFLFLWTKIAPLWPRASVQRLQPACSVEGSLLAIHRRQHSWTSYVAAPSG
jgi:hypothetical protein